MKRKSEPIQTEGSKYPPREVTEEEVKESDSAEKTEKRTIPEESPIDSQSEKEQRSPIGFTTQRANVLSSLINDLNSKSKEDLVEGFIGSKLEEPTPKAKSEEPEEPEIKAQAIKSEGTRQICVNALLAVNDKNTREGFLEIVTVGPTSNKQTHLLVFRNAIKNVVYQAILMPSSKLTPCKDQILTEEETDHVELEISVVRKTEKISIENCRISVSNDDKNKLVELLSKLYSS